MKKIFEKKTIRYRLIIITIITILLFDLSFLLDNSIADAGCTGTFKQIYLGNERVTFYPNYWDYTHQAYICYDSETVNNVHLHSMTQIVQNYGTFDLEGFAFEAYNYDFSKNSYYTPIDNPKVQPGKICRVEANWHEVTKYKEGYDVLEKGPTDSAAVVTNLFAGASEGGDRWTCLWFRNHREIEHHS